MRQKSFPKCVSNGDLDDSGRLLVKWMIEVPGKTSLDGLIEVLKKFLESLSLSRAAGNGRDFGPIAAFLFFMNYDFNFHYSVLRGVSSHPDFGWNHSLASDLRGVCQRRLKSARSRLGYDSRSSSSETPRARFSRMSDPD